MALRLAIVMIGFCFSACLSRPQRDLIKYIDLACDSLEYYSIHRDLNVDSVKENIVLQLTDTSTIRHVHSILNSVVRSIDPHGFLLGPQEQRKLVSGEGIVPEPFPFRGKLIEQQYAYLDIRGFSGVDSISADQYTDSLQRVLISLYQGNPKGWIIDLRSNTGGNPYAMIAGLGPLLAEGNLAYSMNAKGEKEHYFYMRENPQSAKKEHLLLADSAFLFDEKLPIAALIGPETASAAEILTIIFKGMPNALIIGQPTYGVSTGLHPVYLPDSACLYITNSVDHDRFDRAYGKSVEPDIMEKDALKIFEHAYGHIDDFGGKSE